MSVHNMKSRVFMHFDNTKTFFGTDFRTNTAFLHVSDREKGRQEEEKGEEEEERKKKRKGGSYFLLSCEQFSTDLRKKYRRLRARRRALYSCKKS